MGRSGISFVFSSIYKTWIIYAVIFSNCQLKAGALVLPYICAIGTLCGKMFMGVDSRDKGSYYGGV